MRNNLSAFYLRSISTTAILLVPANAALAETPHIERAGSELLSKASEDKQLREFLALDAGPSQWSLSQVQFIKQRPDDAVRSLEDGKPVAIILRLTSDEDRFVEINRVDDTGILRPIVRKGDTAYVQGDVTKSKAFLLGPWSAYDFKWDTPQFLGRPISSFTKYVLEGSPEAAVLEQKQAAEAQQFKEQAERAARESSEAQEAARLARRHDEARLAQETASFEAQMLSAITTIIGKWIPYTIMRDGQPSTFRAIQFERLNEASGSDAVKLLRSSTASGPKITVPARFESGWLKFEVNGCTTQISLNRPSSPEAVPMAMGYTECRGEKVNDVAVLLEERSLDRLVLPGQPHSEDAPDDQRTDTAQN